MARAWGLSLWLCARSVRATPCALLSRLHEPRGAHLDHGEAMKGKRVGRVGPCFCPGGSRLRAMHEGLTGRQGEARKLKWSAADLRSQPLPTAQIPESALGSHHPSSSLAGNRRLALT